MHRLLLAISLIGLLGACATDVPAFAKMTSAEIAAYNDQVAYQDQVICFSETRIGTHIKRRYCETIAQIQTRLHSATGQLNAANLGTASVYTAN